MKVLDKLIKFFHHPLVVILSSASFVYFGVLMMFRLESMSESSLKTIGLIIILIGVSDIIKATK